MFRKSPRFICSSIEVISHNSQKRWLKYNILSVLFDLIEPFVNSHKAMFDHWHYLFEQNSCGSTLGEVRLRFEGTTTNLATIKTDLIAGISAFQTRTNLVMADTDTLGSHEGSHGARNQQYQGEAGAFGNDWNAIIEILQVGSESALMILHLGRGLTSNHSLTFSQRMVNHPYYLHLPANQLLVEP